MDEGRGAQSLTVQQQRPDAALPKDVVTGNSYVFDVFRVSGGNAHTYCFHGPVSESLEINLPDRKPIARGTPEDKNYLTLFSMAPETQSVSPAPKELVATWRMLRRGKFSEEFMLGPLFDPKSPPKNTRLTLFGLDNARAYLADSVCRQWGYNITCLMARKTANQPLESAFVALIEPYVGESFITAKRLVDIPANESDALRATAVEVKTSNRHTDLCFADGRPEKSRTVGVCEVAGAFAYYSTDSGGLRQASLTGGTLLSTPEVRLKAARRERTGKVVKVDYAERRIWIDRAWPAFDRAQLFEIGSLDGGGGNGTSYTARTIRPVGKDQSVIAVTRGADLYRSQVREVNKKAGTVRCSLAPRGGLHNMVASNDAQTRFWRAEASGNTFVLTGGPVSSEDFGKEGVLRLWEYGVGDTVRQNTFVSLRRLRPHEYELTGDVDVEVTLGGKTQHVSATDLARGPVQIRTR